MEYLMDWAKALAVFGGVVVGIFAVFSSSWVWLRRQILGWGGSVLCGFGTILIVASIFRTVTFNVSPSSGLEFKLAELQKQLEAVSASVNETKLDVQRTQAAIKAPSAQFAAFAKDLNFVAFRVEQIEKNSQDATILTKLNDLQNTTGLLSQRFERIDNLLRSTGSGTNPNQPIPLPFPPKQQ
jgi:septal ring factor EnvC (AmiA/AmiB activator)